MPQESQKSHIVLILVAIIGIIGTIAASVIVADSNRKIEEERQSFELTKIALISIVTQNVTPQVSIPNTISTPTSLPILNTMSAPTSMPIETQPQNNLVANCATSPGSYNAGTPICMDGFVLAFDQNALSVGGESIMLNFSVKNIDSRNRIFRYAPSSIIVRDDTGINYLPTGYQCSSMDLNTVEQVQINMGETRTFDSGSSSFSYCASYAASHVLPYYTPAISTNATKIIISFNGFGSYNELEIIVDL
jgi:hypothetical protein